MSELVPNVFQKTKLIDDAVTLFTGNQVYQGWKSSTIGRQLQQAAGTFSMEVVDKWRVDAEPIRLRPGNDAHIHIGKTSVFRGYIDEVNIDLQAQNRNINISGRTKTEDIVDSSITGKNEYKNLNIQEIANKLLEPFNVQLVMLTSPGKAFDKFVTRQGETVFEAIDRLARARSLIVYPSFEGNLILNKKASTRASTELRAGVNVLSGSASYNNSERFQKYTVKGQAPGSKGTPEQAIGAIGTATDAGISRFRELLIIAENVADNNAAIERAKYEADIRAAKSVEVNVTVQGWFQKSGQVWDVNQLVFADIGFLGFRSEALIKGVNYIKDASGTKADLTLIRPDAFEFNQTVSKEKDPVDLLGWEKV